MLTLLLALATPAHAQPAECLPLAQAEFRSLLLDTQAAIDRADVASHRTFVEELRGRLPCVQFVPSTREWAEYLVAWSLLEFGDSGDWQTPLSTALQIRPGVDRGVGQAHPISRFEAPEVSPEEGTAVPAGLVVHVDGARAGLLPLPAGVHLVQKEDEGYFESRVLVGEAVDLAWLRAPVERPLVWSWEAWGGAAVGASYLSQVPTTVVEPAYVPEDQRLELLPLVELNALGRRGRLGLRGELSLQAPALNRLSLRRAEATGRLGGDRGVELGVGLVGSSVIEGVPGTGGAPQWALREVELPYGALGMSTVGERGDARLGLGAGPAVQRGALELGLHVSGGRVRLGLELDGQRGVFVQEDLPERGATNWQLRGALGLRWALGATD